MLSLVRNEEESCYRYNSIALPRGFLTLHCNGLREASRVHSHTQVGQTIIARGKELRRHSLNHGLSLGRVAAIYKRPTISIHALEILGRFGTDQGRLGSASVDLAFSYAWLACQKMAKTTQGHLVQPSRVKADTKFSSQSGLAAESCL